MIAPHVVVETSASVAGERFTARLVLIPSGPGILPSGIETTLVLEMLPSTEWCGRSFAVVCPDTLCMPATDRLLAATLHAGYRAAIICHRGHTTLQRITLDVGQPVEVLEGDIAKIADQANFELGFGDYEDVKAAVAYLACSEPGAKTPYEAQADNRAANVFLLGASHAGYLSLRAAQEFALGGVIAFAPAADLSSLMQWFAGASKATPAYFEALIPPGVPRTPADFADGIYAIPGRERLLNETSLSLLEKRPRARRILLVHNIDDPLPAYQSRNYSSRWKDATAMTAVEFHSSEMGELFDGFTIDLAAGLGGAHVTPVWHPAVFVTAGLDATGSGIRQIAEETASQQVQKLSALIPHKFIGPVTGELTIEGLAPGAGIRWQTHPYRSVAQAVADAEGRAVLQEVETGYGCILMDDAEETTCADAFLARTGTTVSADTLRWEDCT